MDLPQRELHACLIEIGRVIFELFVPHEFLTTVRYGPHYVGIEYQADVITFLCAKLGGPIVELPAIPA